MSRNKKKGYGGKHTRPKKSGPALAVLPDRRQRPWNVTLIYVQGLAEIIVQVRGYVRHSPNQVMIKRE